MLYAGILLVAGLGCSVQKTTPGAKRLLPPTSGVYLGAFPDLSGAEDDVTSKRLDDFLQLSQRKPVWVYFSQNWMDGIVFPKASVECIRAWGAIPFIRLMNRSHWKSHQKEEAFSLEKIAGGVFDPQLRAWARDAKAAAIPMLVEFGTEVNGDWFGWSGVWNGGAKGGERFKEAYRHIVSLFREEGAANVTWCFHVNAGSAPEQSWNTMASYYPGDEWVDWIGVSVYGAQSASEKCVEFQTQFDAVYKELCEISSSKPLGIFEFGVTEGASPVNKYQWIEQFFSAFEGGRYPRIKAISVWHERFEEDGGEVVDLRIDSSSEVLALWRRKMNIPIYANEPVFSGS